MRFALVLGVIGKILRIYSVAFIPPLLLATYNAYHKIESDYAAAIGFAVAAVATLVCGFY